jgi:6-phosphogluconate dehydrogenase
MGSMMSLLFASHDIRVSMYDPSSENVDKAYQNAKNAGFDKLIDPYKDYDSLCSSLPIDSPRIYLWSIPHGTIGDSILDSLDPYLNSGDIIIDAANEFYLNTQRRQGRSLNRGVHYIGTGVSGGYQAARSGPSLSPGGDKKGLELVMPLLEKIAARDSKGNACVAMMGPGGSGHYVKMIHNGIEQGMMVALGEAWGIMHHDLEMSYEEIADEFKRWNDDGELKGNFLIDIGVDICRTQDPESKKPVLDEIKDKVVQDVDESEGTGFWTCEEGFKLHIPMPTIVAAHTFRIASADANRRKANFDAAGHAIAETKKIEVDDRKRFLEDIRLAVYAAFLASFVQGLKLLAKAGNTNFWKLDFIKIIGIWRGGCIIRSEAISELLLEVYGKADDSDIDDLLSSPKIEKEFAKAYPSLKNVLIRSLEADAVVPTLAATLEYLKYSTTKKNLPTVFVEAELDYFGHHNFDLASGPGNPETGMWMMIASGVEQG